jgi:hypothetical protein
MIRKLAVVFGVVSLVLIGVLVTGLLLPGTWSAERSIEIEAPPEAVSALLEDLAAWSRWAPWGEVQSKLSSPSSGVGATRSWDDEQYGEGVIRITGVEPARLVTYRVELEGGRATIDGRLELEPSETGTRLRWTEEGDFGRNPLMGYVARGMSDSQGAQMEETLARLALVTEGG